MPLARLVVLFLAGAGCFLSAQTTGESVLTVRVQDATSTFVPNATIHIVSASGSTKEVHTDLRGEATLSLAPGDYSLTVRALGFRSWGSTASLSSGSDRSIYVELKVGEIYGPTMVNDPLLECEHYAPVVELPTLSLESLSLRAHHLRISRAAYQPV
jgi:hypothetical protein